MYVWLKNHVNEKKSQAITPLPVYRRIRERTGYDMFRASNDSDLPPRIFKKLDDGRKIFDVGQWTSLAKIAWEGLKDKQKEKYNDQASQFMKNHSDGDVPESANQAVSRRQCVLCLSPRC